MIWTNDTQVILYGAAFAGALVFKKLTGFSNIIAFIDKRANEISSSMGLPVYEIDSASLSNELKHEAVVIVCVKNIFEHEHIVLDLLKHGFCNIVFCPVDGSSFEYRDVSERRYLSDVYLSIVEKDLQLPVNIPSADGLFFPVFKDSAIISKEEGSVKANIPSFLAFTKNTGNNNNGWGDSPILTLFTHQEVFDWFSGDIHANPNYYLDLYCGNSVKSKEDKTQNWKDNILTSRKMIYEKMRMAEDISTSFFSEHAVPCEWNPKGHFNMIGGKHRAAYLVHRRKVMIPLIISENDYNIYLNIPVAQELAEYCKTNRLFELPYPIYHPWFYSMAFTAENSYYELMLKIFRWLSVNLYEDRNKLKFDGITIYDGTKGAFFPILLSMSIFGCQSETAYVINEFDELVGRLYHLSEPPVHNGDYRRHYDILFTENNSGLLLNNANYVIMKLDNLPNMIESAKLSVVDFNIIHKNRSNVIAVGKGKNL